MAKSMCECVCMSVCMCVCESVSECVRISDTLLRISQNAACDQWHRLHVVSVSVSILYLYLHLYLYLFHSQCACLLKRLIIYDTFMRPESNKTKLTLDKKAK